MLLKIGEVARRLGVTPRAIRHYEDMGLIAPHSVQDNNYRLYSQRELVLLDNIIALAKLGIPLAEIKNLLAEFQQENMDDVQQVRRLLALQLTAVEQNISQLKVIGDVIRQADFALELNKDNPLELVKSVALTLEKNRSALERWQDRWQFDEQAQGYDQVTGKGTSGYDPHENYQQVLDFVAELTSGAEIVLDVGIGTGNLAKELLRQGCRVIGIDQSKEMLRKAKEKLPAVEMLEANMLALPLEDEAVDAVVSTYALHHLIDQHKELAVIEMVRVLRPGGHIALGDNMFLDQAARDQEKNRLLANGRQGEWQAIEDEYLANVSFLVELLKEQGLRAGFQQMARYTWVVWAQN